MEERDGTSAAENSVGFLVCCTDCVASNFDFIM